MGRLPGVKLAANFTSRRQRLLQHAKLNYGCVYLSTTLYCENAKQHLFLGSTFTRCHSAIEKEFIFLLFFEDEKQFLRGEGECSICYLNHPAINNWSLLQNLVRLNVRRKSNCIVQNGKCYIRNRYVIEQQTTIEKDYATISAVIFT